MISNIPEIALIKCTFRKKHPTNHRSNFILDKYNFYTEYKQQHYQI